MSPADLAAWPELATLSDEELALVGGAWGFSLQGRTPLPGGGSMQGGFTIGSDGIGFGWQGQTPLPWGGYAQGQVRAGDYQLPALPPPPRN